MCIILLETSFDLNVNVVVVVARICVAENAMMINPLQLWFGSTAVLIRRRRGEGRQNITILGEKCTGQKTCATELSKILEGIAAVDIWFRISDRSMDFHVFALIIVDSTIIRWHAALLSYSCVRGTCRKYFFSFFTNVESTQFIIICRIFIDEIWADCWLYFSQFVHCSAVLVYIFRVTDVHERWRVVYYRILQYVRCYFWKIETFMLCVGTRTIPTCYDRTYAYNRRIPQHHNLTK